MTWGSLRGKPRLPRNPVDAPHLRGDAHAPDADCGCGMRLELARHLPHGSATGIDRWSRCGQRGNAAGTTVRNAAPAGVAERLGSATGNYFGLRKR